MIYKKRALKFNLVAEKSPFNSVKITQSKVAYDFLRPLMFDDLLLREVFFVLTLNRANNVTGYAHISTGGISGTVVDVRIIAKIAVDALAASIILAHNHPSGSTQPSEADKQITAKIASAMKLLDVVVLDHIIMTDESFFSFADNGLI